MIIDAHIHLWSHDHERFPDISWREDGQSRLPAADGRGDVVVPLMDGSGVAWALNVQVPWYREDNRYHLDVVSRFPGRFGFLAVMDLTPGAGARYETLHHELGARGFRIHHDEIDRLLDGSLDDLLQMALTYDVPLQFLGRAEHMAKLREVVRRWDGLRIVIDHLAHPNPDAAPDYAAWADFFALGHYPRAYVKVSLQVNCSHAPWPHADLHGFTQRTLETFTPQRCMWGSNWPLIPETVTYDEILAIVRDELPGLAGDDKDWLLGRTAASLWQPVG